MPISADQLEGLENKIDTIDSMVRELMDKVVPRHSDETPSGMKMLPLTVVRELLDELFESLKAGKMVDVAKAYRILTGTPLKDAKDYVDATFAGLRFDSTTTSSALVNEIMDYVAAGKKIEAIKKFREATGASLKEAKDSVEKYYDDWGKLR